MKVEKMIKVFVDAKAEYDKECEAIIKEVEEKNHNAFKKYTDKLEDGVRDMTVEQFEELLEEAKDNDDIDAECMMTLITAFKKTHKECKGKAIKIARIDRSDMDSLVLAAILANILS